MDYKETKHLVEAYTSAMNLVFRRVTSVMNEKVHKELTTDQFGTLRYLYQNESCTSSDIANEFAIGKSAVTAQINRLVDRGFIERVRDESDRRVVFLHLTEEGKQLVEKGNEKLYEVLGDVLSHFEKEEVTNIIEKLEKLADILEHKE
ncbi:MarR family winged helix-turn-helix transcriptional regulator [Salirhabdus sp. Marseille-P4669]|uniref:MarR family winged helix-turn-helix transcriptional regulator n=1 Tax=Salirhabdus sp. Marseille-P4669 TaxID=2042310 RepID=UPI000C7ABB1B|nr:MarR family transcriptional regulator [Salirhabdus sp. Marseille-P4669]